MKGKKKNTKLIVAIIALVVVALIAVVSIIIVNMKDDNGTKKKEEKKEKNAVDIGDNMIYYYTKFKYDNNKIVGIETSHKLDAKEADFVEKYEYEDEKISKISLKDNEYGETDEEMKVTYDKMGNMNIENTVGYYKYEIVNGLMFSITNMDTEAGIKEVIAKVNYDKEGKITSIYIKDYLDVTLSKIIEYKYGEDSKISNITVTHPKREQNKNYKEDDTYDNLTVDFIYDEGIAIANVKNEGKEQVGMYVYYYNKEGFLDYVQMCAVDENKCNWLGDIHEFPGKELWNCILEWPFNPIIKLP